MLTCIAKKDLPRGLARAIALLAPKGTDVKIEAREVVTPSTNSQSYTCANALVENLDSEASVKTRMGVWGGDNGFNRAPADRTFDPVFDNEQREVPLGGAIVVGTVGRCCNVYVHPTTFAERFVKHDVARDALLEGRIEECATIQSDASALSDEECAVLYAHYALKSGDYRKAVVNAYPLALDACVSRGLIKRSKNGACAITTEGKALEGTWRKRGEPIAWRAR